MPSYEKAFSSLFHCANLSIFPQTNRFLSKNRYFCIVKYNTKQTSTMRFIDRLIFLLIEYDNNAPWWRCVNTSVNEGAIIGLSLFLWSNVIFILGIFLCAKTNSNTLSIILPAYFVMLCVSTVLSFALSIRQNKDKIEDVPISIPDKYLKVFLFIYIVVPVALALIGFLMLATHAFFGWFSFMD